MKRALIGIGVAAVLALVVFFSIRSARTEKGVKVYAEAATRSGITQVVKASGEIQPRLSVDISAHVVAKIEKLYVDEGDRIQAGKKFLELEKDTYQASVESWRAQVRQAATGVHQAEVSLADAEVKLQRMHHLAEEGIATTEQLEAAELTKTSAGLTLEAQHDALRNAKANLSKAEDDLAKTTIYAPITGRVVQLNAHEGEVVVSGLMNNPATKIATVADLSEILAELDVDENEIVDVHLDQQVTVTVDAVSGKTYRGRVIEVGNSGYSKAGQGDVTFFKVKVLLDEADPALRPGMSVRAEIQVATHPDALVVPVQAVLERPPAESEKPAAGEAAQAGAEKPAAAGSETPVQVLFVVAGGKAERRRVTTGLSSVTQVEITSGLEAGEQVVTGPFRTLRDLEDGAAVRIDATKGAAGESERDSKEKD